jgi:predicted transcriptional regulator YheO
MKKLKTLVERLSPTLLEKLRTRKITNAEAAAKLGVSETWLSHTVAAMQEKVPGSTVESREAASKLYRSRRDMRRQLAKKVAKGKLSIDEAASQAACSRRTMYRYVGQL